MIGQASSNLWLDMLHFPIQGRTKKPRDLGLTMVIDKGLGLGEIKDLLSTAGEYIDFLKLGFGTSMLYNQELLEEKIVLVKSFGVDIYPGGTLLEIAFLQGKVIEYILTAKKLGYTAVEISDGTVNIPQEVRARAITTAAETGMKVLTEVGKKDPRDKAHTAVYVEQIKQDIKNGACKVIIEGRESGKGIGFYDRDGRLIQNELEELMAGVGNHRFLILEAPLKIQQQEFILRFGPNVNLGNIFPHEVLSLEALRVGMRGDTLRPVYERTKSQQPE